MIGYNFFLVFFDKKGGIAAGIASNVLVNLKRPYSFAV